MLKLMDKGKQQMDKKILTIFAEFFGLSRPMEHVQKIQTISDYWNYFSSILALISRLPEVIGSGGRQ